MSHKADLALSELLNKHGMLPPATLERELVVVEQIAALGLYVPLGRALRERGVLDTDGVRRVLALPMSEKKRELLADQLRWLKAHTPAEPRIAELAMQCGLVLLADLEEAKSLQEKVREWKIDKRPVEVLIERRKLLPEVAAALFDSLRAPTIAVFSRADIVFCTLASTSRAASPQDLQAAISVQRRLCALTRVGRPIAEILIAQGKLALGTTSTIVDLVRAQCPDEPPHRVFPAVTTKDQDRKIAELVQRGWIPLPQVEESRRVLEAMQELGLQRKLGEAMAARGVVDLTQLDALVEAAKNSAWSPPPLPSEPVLMEPLPDDEGEEAIMLDPLDDDEEVLQADPPSGVIRGGAVRPGGAKRRPKLGRLPKRRKPR